MEKLFGLSGKVALVTGGGGGLGRAITEALLAAGAARVYIVSRKAAVIEVAAQEIDSAGRCIAIAADLSKVEDCRKVASEIAHREEKLDILVNNSGIGWVDQFDSFPEKGWDKVFEINLKAPFFLIQSLAKLLEAGGVPGDPARVINIGSIAGEMSKGSTTFAYGLSKGALHHATRMLALELGPRNITVNAIAPGRFATNMTSLVTLDKDRYDREAAMIPLRRWGNPSELGGAAIFLASPAGAYITGTIIVADGGLSLDHPLNLGVE